MKHISFRRGMRRLILCYVVVGIGAITYTWYSDVTSRKTQLQACLVERDLLAGVQFTPAAPDPFDRYKVPDNLPEVNIDCTAGKCVAEKVVPDKAKNFDPDAYAKGWNDKKTKTTTDGFKIPDGVTFDEDAYNDKKPYDDKDPRVILSYPHEDDPGAKAFDPTAFLKAYEAYKKSHLVRSTPIKKPDEIMADCSKEHPPVNERWIVGEFAFTLLLIWIGSGFVRKEEQAK